MIIANAMLAASPSITAGATAVPDVRPSKNDSADRGAPMSYVSPKLHQQFESLSIDLKNEIISRDVQINNLYDLIAVLQQIVDEAESAT
jgi:hypothetical protein